MNGIEQVIIGPGRGVGPMGIHIAEAGGRFGGLDVLWLVLGLLLWAAVMVTLVMLMIALVRNLRNRPAGPAKTDTIEASKAEALKALDDRYARGEIDRKEYLQRKDDLTKA